MIAWLILNSLEMKSYYSTASIAQVLLKKTLEKQSVFSKSHFQELYLSAMPVSGFRIIVLT